jgi:hypothetical protein
VHAFTGHLRFASDATHDIGASGANRPRDGWFSRDLTVGGTISGNGSGLTSLNASNLASGVVPSARLSGAYTNVTQLGTLTSLDVNGDVTKRGSPVPRVVISTTTPTGTFQDGDLWIVP